MVQRRASYSYARSRLGVPDGSSTTHGSGTAGVSAFRLAAPAGLWIERARPVEFSFNGRSLTGYSGDTLASALLANGVALVGRSFKLHRPRGIWSCGLEEPSSLVDVGS